LFCPTCGRDNSVGRKFCASCGTNLEAVSQALSASDDDFFTKIDSGLDTSSLDTLNTFLRMPLHMQQNNGS